jgi:hypothetical protein
MAKDVRGADDFTGWQRSALLALARCDCEGNTKESGKDFAAVQG